jgi:hypothetical protein
MKKNETMYYSPSRQGFYPIEDKEAYERSPSGWPEDAIELDYDYYLSLIYGQNHGKNIKPDENGYPILVDPPAPSKDELIQEASRKKERLMIEASNLISTLQDAVDLDMATDEEKTKLLAWKKYRVYLNRVDTSEAPDITWPDKP